MNIKSLSIAAILPFTLAACLIGEPPLSGTYVATEGMIVKSMTFEDSSVTVTGMMGQRSVGTVAYEDDTAILSIGNDKVPLKIEGDCISGNEGMMKMRLCKEGASQAVSSSSTTLPEGHYSGTVDGATVEFDIYQKTYIYEGETREYLHDGKTFVPMGNRRLVYVTATGNCLVSTPEYKMGTLKFCKE